MKKFTIQAIFLLIIIFGFLALATSRLPGLPFIPQILKTADVYIDSVKMTVEVADTSQKRAKGLSDKVSLASDSGMLFLFDEPKVYSFWMKGMKIPLDFIWIRQNKVVDIIAKVSPPTPGQPDETLPIYQPNQPIDMLLEVNAGFVENSNIKIGDTVQVVLK